ncbi:MAG: agarase, partial [Lentisphaeria bacterium]|nr:agarase [Lentisphaeria bacterium]
DCPTWAHAPKWNPKGPWFDPESLKTEAGRRELQRTAEQYYRVTHDAIRRYDANHLILGERYEAKALLPEGVLLAAAPTIDVLSFQYFAPAEAIAPDFERWHALTGKPVLLADACMPQRQPEAYGSMIRGLRDLPCCVGWHVCGAYLANRVRKHGFRDERNRTVEPLVSTVARANRETERWVHGE